MAAPKESAGTTRNRVLSLLEREADMDGVVIAVMAEIADILDISNQAVSVHIKALANNGEITIEPAKVKHNLKKITLLNF